MKKVSIYTASRVRHAPLWLAARADGFDIISTWIDEAGEGQSVSMMDLWHRCVDEARSADALILYREGEEMLKGALVEMGAALGAGIPVYAVGFSGADTKAFSFLNHPLVTRCETLKGAFAFAQGVSPRVERQVLGSLSLNGDTREGITVPLIIYGAAFNAKVALNPQEVEETLLDLEQKGLVVASRDFGPPTRWRLNQ